MKWAKIIEIEILCYNEDDENGDQNSDNNYVNRINKSFQPYVKTLGHFMTADASLLEEMLQDLKHSISVTI